MNVNTAITLGLVLCVSSAIGNICNYHKNGAQLPSHEDCSAYYVCNHGEPTLFKCREPLLYDNLLGVCNWAENVTCGQVGYPDQPHILPIEVTPATRPTLPSTTRQPITLPPVTRPPVTRPPVTQPPPTPAVQPTRPPYVNYPQYPNYPSYPNYAGYPPYYVEGTPENGQNHQRPPPIFDNTGGRPEYVNNPHPDPYPQPLPVKPEPEPVTPIQTQPPVTTQRPLPTTQKPLPTTTKPNVGIEYYPGVISSPHNPNMPRCTKDGLYFAPHPTDCQRYFICENHRVHNHQCGAGIYWDYMFSQCVKAETAFCYSEYNQDGRPEVQTTPRPQSTIGVTGPIAIATLQPPTPPPLVPENIADPIIDCPGNQAFFAHKSDCRKYYICIGGIPISTSCPEKMAWDNDNLQCSEDAASQCLSHLMASMLAKS